MVVASNAGKGARGARGTGGKDRQIQVHGTSRWNHSTSSAHGLPARHKRSTPETGDSRKKCIKRCVFGANVTPRSDRQAPRQMSPGRRLPATASSLILPRGLPTATGLACGARAATQGFQCGASGLDTRVAMPLWAKSRRRGRPQAGAGGHSPARASRPAARPTHRPRVRVRNSSQQASCPRCGA